MLYVLVIEDLRRFVTESLQSDDSSLQQSKLNLLKMNIYIISLFIKTYEEKLCYQSDNFIVDKVSFFFLIFFSLDNSLHKKLLILNNLYDI